MKHLTLQLVLFSLAYLITPKNLNAQAECGLPAPTDPTVLWTSTTSAEIAWTEVPGAADYKIETVDLNTGVSVSILFTNNNAIEITGLQPNTPYEIFITSRCDDGSEGGTASLRLNTDVIVVDIILHLNCIPDPNGTTYNNQYASGNKTYLPMPGNGPIVLEGDVSNTSSANFKLVFQPTINIANVVSSQLTIGTTPDYDLLMQFNANIGNGTGQAEYLNPSSTTFEPLVDITPIFAGNNSVLELEWRAEVTTDIIYCYSGPGKDPDKGDEGGALIAISPNPTTGWFSILAPEDTGVTIADLNGQHWYESELFAEEPHEVDGSSWPNGTYIVRTVENGQVVNTLLIKTD